MSVATDERYTPEEVYGPLRRLYGFNVDPCTTESNPLGTPVFFTEKDDGLTREWRVYADYTGSHVFVNPPYSQIKKWAKKAILEASRGAFVAFLLPNDCSTEAWWLLKAASWGQWDIPFRVKFGTPVPGEKKDVARSHVVFFLGGLS